MISVNKCDYSHVIVSSCLPGNICAVPSELCDVTESPMHMYRSDVIVARPVRRPESLNPKGRAGEDESACSSDSMMLEGFVLR